MLKIIRNGCLSILLLASCFTQVVMAQECPPLSAGDQDILLKKHLGPFNPSGQTIVHRPYVFNFNADTLVPNWVAWHIEPSYRDTPKRTGKWSRFRPDPSVPSASRVVTDDYTNSGYHRGHIAPFFVSGGDRDGDGMDAEFEGKRGLPVEDIDDACTVFEINYMTNMSPQLPGFNSQGGAWYDLETKTRGEVDQGASYKIIAGNIFLKNDPKRISNGGLEIAVPDALYKVIYDGNKMTGYLFFQEEMFGYTHGCLPKAELAACEVSIDFLRTIPGVNF